jgi:DNA repair protein RecN (Recombination protein N)
MLRFLAIRNLAVIDHLEIEFEGGLNVLTGETGAGKSVLVEAIDLLVGGRASADLVRTGQEVGAVQAVFERADGREVIVRREVSAQGRSRAFIDDTLATTGALRELGGALVDLHGQHEHQALLDESEHVDLLDAFGAHDEAVAAVAGQYDEWRAAVAAVERTALSAHDRQARLERARFQLQEIERVDPRRGEDESLSAERVVLANADRLGRWSSEAYSALYDGETAALAQLAAVWKRVADLAELDPSFRAHLETRDLIKVQLEDLAFRLRAYCGDLDASPERLQLVEDRLAALERLKRKFGPDLSDVLSRRESFSEEVAALDDSSDRTAALEARAAEAARAFLTAAADVSAARRKAAQRLVPALEAALADLAMPQSRVEVRLTDGAANPSTWTRHGVDDVAFLLSPNPGEDVRPLARIASGGELSRIMLALRTLAWRGEPGRSLIFDEVDAGIGGTAADAVGARLQILAKQHQVVCVTHLAQVAARGGAHFQIAKQLRAGRTVTTVTRLDEAGREAEVARMIAGASVSPQVLASAREMIASRRGESELKAKTKPVRQAKAKGKGAGDGA